MKNEYLYPIVKIGNLWGPIRYFMCPFEERESYLNGCGPGGWIIDMVPDKIYGLSVHSACDIHDWFYSYGQTPHDKKVADGLFLRNLKNLIGAKKSGRWLTRRRINSAKLYYLAVHLFGHDAFWGRKLDV